MNTQHIPIKICGLTTEQDVDTAVQAGAQAIGLVLYPPSPRAVNVQQAQTLAKRLPAFVTPVLLLVNANRETILQACEAVPGAWLQFHGDESPEFCEDIARLTGLRYIRAIRIPVQETGTPPHEPPPSVDLVKYVELYKNAHALLLDAWVPGYGGGGQRFDWSLIPEQMNAHLVLSGGLTAQNVAQAIAHLTPRVLSLALDVSSGVESRRGVKDTALIREFIQAVRAAQLPLGPH
jgi:phosphoribosylanthranilate isomerase